MKVLPIMGHHVHPMVVFEREFGHSDGCGILCVFWVKVRARVRAQAKPAQVVAECGREAKE